MLTFFRQIRKGLLASGATRKYLLYAIGEIALVVIGILIALQINNWNEFQKERKTERKALEEVVENLEANIQRLQASIERNNIDNQSADLILSVIDKKLPYVDSLDRYFPYALNPVDEGSFLSFVGYESLKNVGFEIIIDDHIKKEIIKLFEGTYQNLKARYDRIDESRSEINSFHRQHFYRKGSNFEFTPLDFDNLVKDKHLYSWLNSMKGYRVWILSLIHESLAETERVLQLVKDELGGSD